MGASVIQHLLSEFPSPLSFALVRRSECELPEFGVDSPPWLRIKRRFNPFKPLVVMIYFVKEKKNRKHNDPLNFNDGSPAQGFIVLTPWPLPFAGEEEKERRRRKKMSLGRSCRNPSSLPLPAWLPLSRACLRLGMRLATLKLINTG